MAIQQSERITVSFGEGKSMTGAVNQLMVHWIPGQKIPRKVIKEILKDDFEFNLADVVIVEPQHWWEKRKVYVKKDYRFDSRDYQRII